MMWIVRLALRRPYTFAVVGIMIAVIGVLAALTMRTDIFPDIDIPVVSVIWRYDGMSPSDIENRIMSVVERVTTSTVDGADSRLSDGNDDLDLSR